MMTNSQVYKVLFVPDTPLYRVPNGDILHVFQCFVLTKMAHTHNFAHVAYLSQLMLIFGDAKYSQALKYKPCIGKISMVYLCKSK